MEDIIFSHDRMIWAERKLNGDGVTQAVGGEVNFFQKQLDTNRTLLSKKINKMKKLEEEL